MNCYRHADRAPAGTCVSCGNFICDECRVTMEDRMYCKRCLERGAERGPARKELRRSYRERVIAGVCGGLAEYFDIDTTLFRVLYVVATLFTAFAGVLAYIVLWIVIPNEGRR